MPDLDQRKAEPQASGMFDDAMQVFAPHENSRAQEGLMGVQEEGLGMFERLLGELAAPEPTLREGDSGAEVLALQRLMSERGVGIDIDGAFGPQTKAALARFQAGAGLKADGIYGPATREALIETPETRGAQELPWEAPDGRKDQPDLKIPLRDVIYEQLAHRSAYLHFPCYLQEDEKDWGPDKGGMVNSAGESLAAPEYDTAEEDWVNALGYEPEVVVDDPQTGFQAVLFVPTLDGVWIKEAGKLSQSLEDLRPAIAFRGSQSTESWNDDANPEGAGAMQFRLNEAKITRLLNGGVSKAGKPDVIGHSLGGGLAQMTASHYPDMVNDVVTFQAVALSGTDEDFSDQTHKEKDVTHYRVSGDVVPSGGVDFLKGKEVPLSMSNLNYFDMDNGFHHNMVDAHTAFPLATAHQGMAAQDQRHLHMMAMDPTTSGARDAVVEDPGSVRKALPGLLNAFSNYQIQSNPILSAITNEPVTETVRKSGAGTPRTHGEEDYLNGPVTRLAEDLRVLVNSWRKDGLTGAALHAKIRTYVDGQRENVCRSALVEKHGKYAGGRTVPPMLEIESFALCDQLVEQTIELDEQQQSGKINRRGWEDGPGDGVRP